MSAAAVTACRACRAGESHRCLPSMHSPGGVVQGTYPFRPGKTDRDHVSGAWARRYANRRARAEKQRRQA